MRWTAAHLSVWKACKLGWIKDFSWRVKNLKGKNDKGVTLTWLCLLWLTFSEISTSPLNSVFLFCNAHYKMCITKWLILILFTLWNVKLHHCFGSFFKSVRLLAGHKHLPSLSYYRTFRKKRSMSKILFEFTPFPFLSFFFPLLLSFLL